MSLFKEDLNQEAILGQFLNRQYKNAGLKVERINHIALQHQGVDLILEGENNLTFKIDEKAQLHYINKDLPTFALEIGYLKDGKLKQGWLFDSRKATEIYAFIFSIHLLEEIKSLTKPEEIASCEVIFVNRIKLINELSKNNIGIAVCHQQSELLRSENKVTKINFSPNFNFQISHHLTEKPVNLIVRKTFLELLGKKYLFKK